MPPSDALLATPHAAIDTDNTPTMQLLRDNRQPAHGPLLADGRHLHLAAIDPEWTDLRRECGHSTGKRWLRSSRAFTTGNRYCRLFAMV